jgi:CheY-like chemotaxis protein
MQTILIIDDDEETRSVLAELLNGAGYYVYLAAGGDEGVRLFRSERIEVALVDIWMSEKDGLETIMDLRRMVPDAKIIAMTGTVKAGLINPLSWARRLGAKATLRKPFSAAELLTAVSDTLSFKGDGRVTLP